MPVPHTNIRTSHAVVIRAPTGQVVGQIQTWAPSQSRGITSAYELNSVTSGEVTENVPGNITGLTIQVSRYDMFTSRMEEVWGSTDLTMLSKQLDPLDIEEKWSIPPNAGGGTQKWTYYGCWFSQVGRNLQAQGDRIVLVNATLNYVRIAKA